MKRLTVLGLIGFAAISLAQPAPGPRRGGVLQDAPPILRKMMMSARTLKYSGTRVVTVKRGADRESHTELILRDGPRMRIEFPQGSPQHGQIIIEAGRDRFHFFPGLNEIHTMPSRADDGVERLGMFLRERAAALKITTSRGPVIAELPTEAVVISDKQGNPVQRLWIHPRSGMLVKRELVDPLGTVVGAYEFQSVNLNPEIKEEDFRVRRQGAKVVAPRDILRRMAREAGLEPLTLPEGERYRLEGARVMNNERGKILVQTYQSPTGPLSFFATKMDINLERFRRLASRDSFRSFAWQQGGVTYALVGNETDETLKRLARQIGN
ncbi:MAG TPA: hypothetical protein PKA27_08075 [Fimbriimonadaceae bacterium]|nr:hypothetical protein [Fimbriimonadaceae bacterium]